jgi:hypothetical protein
MEIKVNELPHPGLFENYRDCPHCAGKFTADPDTKRRQLLLLPLGLISLAVTLLLYFAGTQWLAPALISYAILGSFLYWANKKVFFVPYE